MNILHTKDLWSNKLPMESRILWLNTKLATKSNAYHNISRSALIPFHKYYFVRKAQHFSYCSILYSYHYVKLRNFSFVLFLQCIHWLLLIWFCLLQHWLCPLLSVLYLNLYTDCLVWRGREGIALRAMESLFWNFTWCLAICLTHMEKLVPDMPLCLWW
jgi:hypothetical protein